MTEDRSKNRLQEAIDLFGQVVNSHLFAKTDVILFLNKKALFEMKLKKNPLNKYYPEYTGGDDFEAACKFFRGKFIEKNKKERQIYAHEMCATDTGNVRFLFDSVVSMILDQNMSCLLYTSDAADE